MKIAMIKPGRRGRSAERAVVTDDRERVEPVEARHDRAGRRAVYTLNRATAEKTASTISSVASRTTCVRTETSMRVADPREDRHEQHPDRDDPKSTVWAPIVTGKIGL